MRRRPCAGFFGGIGDVHAAARKESAQADGDEFNGFSVFADNQDGDRLTLRHQDIPVLPGNSSKPSPRAISQGSPSRDLRHTSLYAFAASELGRASEDEDVHSTGGGGKPSLHAMEWAISLVGGSLTGFDDEQN